MSINDEIETIINHKIKQQPTPEIVTITKTHDNNHCDVKTNNGNKIEYLLCIGTPQENETALIIPYKNSYVVITR